MADALRFNLRYGAQHTTQLFVYTGRQTPKNMEALAQIIHNCYFDFREIEFLFDNDRGRYDTGM